MGSMDFQGIAWVGNIYQKFEAMCLEVEEAMCQETAKYVENQVQTVGGSMKRFCSDVMQDLLPPSSKDLSKVASADLLLNPYLEFGIHKKPISSIKEDAKDKSASTNDDAWEDWSAASFDFDWDIEETNCDSVKTLQTSNECGSRGKREGQIRKMIGDTSFISPSPRSIVLTKHSKKEGKRSRLISSRADHTDACESSGLVSQNIDGNVSHTDSCENSMANTQCDQSVGEEVYQEKREEEEEEEEEEKGTTVQSIEANGHESETGFEETCVLVEGNDYHPVNHKQEIYKLQKKIQKAFFLKKKSGLGRKQEYKQLAAEFVNAEAASKNMKSKRVEESDDSLESEWEIL